MTKIQKTWSCTLLLAVLTATSGHGNTDSRNWTLVTGERIHAELVKYDLTLGVAILRTDDDTVRTNALSAFCAIDAAWLLEWTSISIELNQLSTRLKGEFRHYQHGGAHPADVYVYTPSKYRQTTSLPMLFLFHPAGKGARYVKQFMEAAEALDLIVVSSDAFRNTGGVWNEKDEVMLSCFKELLPELDSTVPHDPRRFYMGGSSGGAQTAYHYSTKIDRHCAGIFSNGGWIGGPAYYNLPFPRGMRIVMVNGQADPANRWIEPDEAVFEKCECDVNLFAFDGGHQVPPFRTQYKALEWMLHGNQEKPAEQPAVTPDPE